MKEQFERTGLLIGEEAVKKLTESKVLVFGIGGVGGFVCEALARAGVGTIDIVDNDIVSESNINRQIIATYSTLGMAKVDVMKDRIQDINLLAKVKTYKCFYLPECSGEFDFSLYDYVVDAIDTTTAKIDIIVKSKASGTPVISSMGTGNKLNNTKFEIADISDTSVCPLAKVMRKELRKLGIENVKVLYSKEEPIKNHSNQGESGEYKRSVPGSISYVPSVAGLIIAGQVINDLIGIKNLHESLITRKE